MQTVVLPVTIDPVQSAARRLEYSGRLSAHRFSRLCEMVESVNLITVDVSFRVNEQGLHVMEGVLQADVNMICQRCGQPFQYAYSVALNMTPNHRDEQLCSSVDQIELNNEGEWDFHQLIEDELLVHLPLVASHEEDSNCTYSEQVLVWGKLPEPEPNQSPFASLKHLKS